MAQDNDHNQKDWNNPEFREQDFEPDKLEESIDEQAPEEVLSVGDGVSKRAEETTAEWFVDFDVWEAALEAKFGPEFEQVLTRELGTEWVNTLNTKMNEHNFIKVLDDIKENITGQDQGGVEGFANLVSNEDRIGFEALGQGEVIYDESMVGPGGVGGGGGGGGGQERCRTLQTCARRTLMPRGTRKLQR